MDSAFRGPDGPPTPPRALDRGRALRLALKAVPKRRRRAPKLAALLNRLAGFAGPASQYGREWGVILSDRHALGARITWLARGGRRTSNPRKALRYSSERYAWFAVAAVLPLGSPLDRRYLPSVEIIPRPARMTWRFIPTQRTLKYRFEES